MISPGKEIKSVIIKEEKIYEVIMLSLLIFWVDIISDEKFAIIGKVVKINVSVLNSLFIFFENSDSMISVLFIAIIEEIYEFVGII